MLIEQGVSSGSLYQVVSGALERVRFSEDPMSSDAGTTVATVTGMHCVGEIIGAAGFLLGAPESTQIRAADMSNVALLEVSHARAIQLVNDDPTLAAHLFHELAAELAERIQARSSELRGSAKLQPVSDGNEVARIGSSWAANLTGATQAKFEECGVKADEALISKWDCSLLTLEKGSQTKVIPAGDANEYVQTQGADGGTGKATKEAEANAVGYLFTRHLCFEVDVFGLRFVESIELGNVLSLIKKGTEIIDIQSAGKSCQIRLQPTDLEMVPKAIEAARIERHAAIARASTAMGGALGALKPNEPAIPDVLTELTKSIPGPENNEGGKQRRNSERRNSERRNSEQRRGSERRGSERTVTVRRGSERRGSERRGSERRGSERRNSFNNLRRHSFDKIMARLSDVSVGARSSALAERLDISIVSALVSQSEKFGAKERMMLLGQQLSQAEWSGVMVKGATQQVYQQGDAVLREGDTTRALYHLVQGTLRAELALPGASKSVVVGRLEVGDVFGERSLLLGGGASVTLVVASASATVVALPEAAFTKLLSSHPELVSKLYCYIAAYQMRRLIGLDVSSVPSIIVESESAQPADLVAISSNAAYLSIFHRYVHSLKLTAPAAKKAEGTTALVDVVDFYVEVDNIAKESDGAQLTEAVRRIYETFLAPGGARELKCISDQLKLQVRNAIPARPNNPEPQGAGRRDSRMRRRSFLMIDTGGPELRHVYDVAASAALRWIEARHLDAFMKSEHYKYVLALKAKESTPLQMHDFKAVRKLGSGTFGQVLEVVKRDCGKHYAMKVMPKPKSAFAERMANERVSGGKPSVLDNDDNWEDWLEAVLLERANLMLLNHPLIINLCYAFQTPSFVAFVMEICSNSDLSRFALDKRCRMDFESVLFVGIEVVAVFSWLHSQKVLFTDLKAENVMLDSEGHLRLVDFGAASIGDASSEAAPESDIVAGTLPYLAPELMAHYEYSCETNIKKMTIPKPPPYSLPADWWAVGVLLYELLEQKLPYGEGPKFEKPSAYALAMQEAGVTEPYRRPELGTPELHSFFEAIFVYDPKCRLGRTGKNGEDVKAHPLFAGVDWELAGQRRLSSPIKDLPGFAVNPAASTGKGKKSREDEGVELMVKMQRKDTKAANIANLAAAHNQAAGMSHSAAAATAAASDDRNIENWDMVSPEALSREYLEQMAYCVSTV